jgi:DNA-binding transcriptional regulator GbsR (MarR family)
MDAGYLTSDAPHGDTALPLQDWERLVVDAVGNVIEFWGFKHNQGRVWALLFVRDAALTAHEIQTVLDLSKGAVSMLSRELEQWRVIRRVREPGSGTWRFEANTSFIEMVRRVLETREQEFLARVKADLERAEQLAAADPRAPEGAVERVRRMRGLADWMEQALRAFIRTATFDVSPIVDALRRTVRSLTFKDRA